METRRLKNIAILILLLLNAFLLLLLGYQQLQSQRAQADTAQQLRDLFSAGQLTLSRDVDLSQEPLRPLLLSRNTDAESSIAAFLLGETASPVSQGGGIYSYTTEYGTIQFRSGGSFDGSRLSLPVPDIDDFVRSFCQKFGYKDSNSRLSGGSGTVTASQQVSGVPINGCGVTLTFEDGALTAVTGAHVSLENAAAEDGDPLSCVSALVRFLDHRRASGVVCREVTGVRCVYELQGSPSSLRLAPVWQVETDTYTYAVDCTTGSVSRQ